MVRIVFLALLFSVCSGIGFGSSVEIAIGQADIVPSSLDMPVQTARDRRVDAGIALNGTPEAYAIEKDGRMYYAFFTDNPKPLTEHLELRGLGESRFHIRDYENGKDYGRVTGPRAQLTATFAEHLLLEASR